MGTAVQPQDTSQTIPLAAPANPAAPPAPAAPKPPAQPAANGQLPIASASTPAIPAPTVAAPAQPVDRVQLAQSAWNTFARASEPYYQKSLRDATSQAAGAGRLMSGQLRTSLGDLSQQRNLELDTKRDELIQKATEGSIADASTAYQQALAGAQQGLAEKLGTGQLAIAQQNANTSETGTLGNLELAKSGQEQQGAQFHESLDFQKEQAKIEAAYKAGTLTLAQRDQALRELANTQQNTLATETFDFQKEQAKIENAYKAGTLTLAQKDQALRELSEKHQSELSLATLAQNKEQFAASLAQAASQFGASQAQQLEIAKLADATSNRQIDLSTELGRNNLLVQLANILGGPTGSDNAELMQQIAKALGLNITLDQAKHTKPVDPTTQTGNPGNQGDTDDSDDGSNAGLTPGSE